MIGSGTAAAVQAARPSWHFAAAAGAALALLGGSAFLYNSSASRPTAAPVAAPSPAAGLVEAAAKQLHAEGPVRIDASTRRTAVSAEGNRLVYHMEIASTVGAAEIAAIRARDAASLCGAVDPSRLIALGGTIELRYAAAGGTRFGSVVASCPGGGAAAKATMPVAL
ncbi:MAG TPA: hypothetical protein VEZ20_12775 [Allosphingosinicella sp.]|nr:hypothetical protein [Allosphingosinicella sp.]